MSSCSRCIRTVEYYILCNSILIRICICCFLIYNISICIYNSEFELIKVNSCIRYIQYNILIFTNSNHTIRAIHKWIKFTRLKSYIIGTSRCAIFGDINIGIFISFFILNRFICYRIRLIVKSSGCCFNFIYHTSYNSLDLTFCISIKVKDQLTIISFNFALYAFACINNRSACISV